MSGKFDFILKSSLLFLLGLLDVCDFNTVIASPEEGVVTEGSAIIKQNTNKTLTEITQHTHAAIIDWKEFNLDIGEQARFIQPSVNSFTLNRVKSDNVSQIHGNIYANGKLVIINQNGVLFGPTANIDVNGLIVTTSDINNEQFSEKLETIKSNGVIFNKPGNPKAKIINQGQITSDKGLIGLIAPNVINSGTIFAKAGKVKLASGTSFALDLYGDDLLKIAVSDDLKSQLILNNGSIIADGNQIMLTIPASNKLINSLIANSGALQARSVLRNKGEIIIMAEGSNAVIDNVKSFKGLKKGMSKVEVSGTMDVSGVQFYTSGGNIKIAGDNISLLDGSVVDASGYSPQRTYFVSTEQALSTPTAGGVILIGGDYLGEGSMPTAKSLYVDSNATILNDSYYFGDAGKCIFWSDELTRFYGKVFARSLGGKDYNLLDNSAVIGGNYGNGGLVEISSKSILHTRGYINLTASRGSFGRYLLDPSQIHIIGSDDVTDSDLVESTLTTAYLAKASNEADLLLSADEITLDLQGFPMDLAKNRNLTINATNSIETVSEGIINTVRTDGNAGGDINFIAQLGSIDLGGLNLNSAGGDINIIANKGPVSLGNLTAGSVTVQALGNSSNIIIYKDNKITAKSLNSPIILVAGGGVRNQNLITSQPFNLTQKDARWLVYYSVPNNNQNMQQSYIGDYIEAYSKGYNINSLPVQSGNMLLYVPQILGNYDSKDIDQESNRNRRLITVDNLKLSGSDANNYSLLEPSASANIGSILPKDLTIMAQPKNRLYGNLDPELTYIIDGLALGDDPSIVKGIDMTTTAESYSPAGIYPINITGPRIIGNYIVNYVNNSFTIIGQPNPIETLKSSPIMETIYSILSSSTVVVVSTTGGTPDTGAAIIVVSPMIYADLMSSTDVVAIPTANDEGGGGISDLLSLPINN